MNSLISEDKQSATSEPELENSTDDFEKFVYINRASAQGDESIITQKAIEAAQQDAKSTSFPVGSGDDLSR